MLKKFIQITGVVVLAGFSFFYTEKVTKIARNSDPIMIKINQVKDDFEVSSVKPIINDDEYIAGVNGCVIDVEKSYTKMKGTGEYNENLLVMNEVNNDKNIGNKYIVGGNKKIKNISIIFVINNNLNNNLVEYLNSGKIKSNFFVSKQFLEKNSVEVKKISKLHNIYYYGDNGVYNEKYIIYDNNLIDVNSNNESTYCLVNKRDENVLNVCTNYNMRTIKSEFITDNILTNVRKKLSNGSIIAFNTDKINDIKVSINYILSKGYNIVSLDELLNESNKCK